MRRAHVRGKLNCIAQPGEIGIKLLRIRQTAASNIGAQGFQQHSARPHVMRQVAPRALSEVARRQFGAENIESYCLGFKRGKRLERVFDARTKVAGPYSDADVCAESERHS